MIVASWPWWFCQLFGGSWPRSYCTFDCETSGFVRDKDLIVEMGHCLVEDGKPVDRLSLVLDWTEHDIVPDHWLRRRLDETRQAMAQDGKTYCMTYERMRAEGVRPPEKVLRFYYDLFSTLIERRFLFAAHGGFFDEEMLAHAVAGFRIADGFQFPDNQLFDTMSIEKGNQLAHDRNAQPRPGETLRSYFRRLRFLKGGGKVRSSLDQHCAVKYDLARRYGLDMSQAHSAGFDAYLVHLLMEEFGAQAAKSAQPPGPPMPGSFWQDGHALEPFGGTLLTPPRRTPSARQPAAAPAAGAAPPRRRRQRNR